MSNNIDNFENNNSLIKPKSKISKLGYKPINFDSHNDKAKHKKKISKDSIRDKKSGINKLSKNGIYNYKHYDNGLSFESKKHKNKKSKIPMIISMVVVEIITLVGIFIFGTFLRYSNMTQKVTFNKANIKNTNIEQSTIEVMKGYKTIAVFGLDARTGSVGRGSNADVNMIVNLNLETGAVKIISIYRDTFLNISSNNSYGKLNSAYSHGGPERAVSTLNKNFDLDIENYFSFNWKAVADGIDMLGGVGIYVTSAEFLYINAFIHEYCLETGIGADNPAAYYVAKPGYQILNGVQALSYCRLRLMDNDFKRRERQVEVIKQCLENAKNLDLGKINDILQKILPQISYAFDMNEMLSIAKTVKGIHIDDSEGIPEINYMLMMDMGASGNCVVPNTLVRAAKKVHEILYNNTDYKPSSAVNTYSARITELKNKYLEENENRQEEETAETDENGETKPVPVSTGTNRSTKKSTPSNSSRTSTNNDETETTKETVEANPNRNSNNNETVVPNLDIPETSARVNPVSVPGGNSANTEETTTRVNAPGMSSDNRTSNNGPGQNTNNVAPISPGSPNPTNSPNISSSNNDVVVVPGAPIS